MWARRKVRCTRCVATRTRVWYFKEQARVKVSSRGKPIKMIKVLPDLKKMLVLCEYGRVSFLAMNTLKMISDPGLEKHRNATNMAIHRKSAGKRKSCRICVAEKQGLQCMSTAVEDFSIYVM